MLHSFLVDKLTADGPGSSTPAVFPPQPAEDQAEGPGSSTPAQSPPQPAANSVPTHIPGTPLTSRMNDSSVHTNVNHSFSDLMPTPRIVKSNRNRARARKSINYTANVVTKQLFDDYNSKVQMNRKAKKSHDKVKPANKGSKKDGQKPGTKGTTARTKVLSAEERIKSSRKKRKSNSKASANGKGSKRAKISSVLNSADGEGAEVWYCGVCKEDKQLTMTKCSVCQTWLHNECVGLESDDDDDFICPYCDA